MFTIKTIMEKPTQKLAQGPLQLTAWSLNKTALHKVLTIIHLGNFSKQTLNFTGISMLV